MVTQTADFRSEFANVPSRSILRFVPVYLVFSVLSQGSYRHGLEGSWPAGGLSISVRQSSTRRCSVPARGAAWILPNPPVDFLPAPEGTQFPGSAGAALLVSSPSYCAHLFIHLFLRPQRDSIS